MFWKYVVLARKSWFSPFQINPFHLAQTESTILKTIPTYSIKIILCILNMSQYKNRYHFSLARVEITKVMEGESLLSKNFN